MTQTQFFFPEEVRPTTKKVDVTHYHYFMLNSGRCFECSRNKVRNDNMEVSFFNLIAKLIVGEYLI